MRTASHAFVGTEIHQSRSEPRGKGRGMQVRGGDGSVHRAGVSAGSTISWSLSTTMQRETGRLKYSKSESNVKMGLLLDHSQVSLPVLAFAPLRRSSITAPTAMTFSSSNFRPMICNPMGRPSLHISARSLVQILAFHSSISFLGS